MNEFESGSGVKDGESEEGAAEAVGAGMEEGGEAAEKARVTVYSRVDNCAAMKVREVSECDASN